MKHKKVLIIKEGESWNKVCDQLCGNTFDYIFIPQELENKINCFVPNISVLGEKIGKICVYKTVI